MARFSGIVIIAIALITGGWSLLSVNNASSQVSSINKDELKGMLGKPDVVIIDVRLPRQWKDSKFKIVDALHEDPGQNTESWAAKYPKDKTIILYCS